MATKAEHTHGTWKRVGSQIKAGNTIIATLWAKSKKGVAEANGELISSSPDLLKALRVLVEHAQEKYPHFESERGQRDIEQALAVLAKAAPK